MSDRETKVTLHVGELERHRERRDFGMPDLVYYRVHVWATAEPLGEGKVYEIYEQLPESDFKMANGPSPEHWRTYCGSHSAMQLMLAIGKDLEAKAAEEAHAAQP